MSQGSALAGALLALGSLASCTRPRTATDAPAPTTLELRPVVLVPHDTLPTGTIRGWLSIDHPAFGVLGATVELPDVGLSAHADSAGWFEVTDVPPGRRRFRARRLGCEPTVGSIDVPPRGGSVVRVLLEVRRFCLDYCPAPQPRAFGRIEAVR